MKLVLDTEQEELRRTIRELLTDRSPSERVREVMASPKEYDRALWRTLGELGLLGLVVPDKFGGAGAGHVERSIVAEELGRSLAPTPFLASAVLATDTLLAVGDEAAAAELLPKLASGELVGTIAVAEGRAGPWDADGGQTTATQRNGRWELDGAKTLVLNGEHAGLILVYARTPDGPGWFAVQDGAHGLGRAALTVLDPTRSVGHLTFAATPARPLTGVDALGALEVVGDLAAIALAAEQVGVLGRAMELTVDYAKIRVQFGRAIGSYQAVKHGCADMYSAWELAVSVLRYAAWTADENSAELGLAAALAQTYIGPASFAAATNMIHYHGGIGYTWEHDAHLFYKRAKSAHLLFGPPAKHRSRLADLLGV